MNILSWDLIQLVKALFLPLFLATSYYWVSHVTFQDDTGDGQHHQIYNTVGELVTITIERTDINCSVLIIYAPQVLIQKM